MLSRRLVIALVAAALAAACAGLAGRAACSKSDGRPAGDGVPSAQASPGSPHASPSAAPSDAGWGGGAGAPAEGDVSEGAGVLFAVRTVKRFCDLVDEGRRAEAARLLAGRWVWPRKELVAIRRLRFESARVQDERLDEHVVLMARVRARLRGPSPLHDGVNTLFITLGRDGTTGGWLITAVTSSP